MGVESCVGTCWAGVGHVERASSHTNAGGERWKWFMAARKQEPGREVRGTLLNLRTTTAQKCAAAPKRARI